MKRYSLMDVFDCLLWRASLQIIISSTTTKRCSSRGSIVFANQNRFPNDVLNCVICRASFRMKIKKNLIQEKSTVECWLEIHNCDRDVLIDSFSLI